MASLTAPAQAREALPEPARQWLASCRVKVFADGPELADIPKLLRQPHIKGITTNPTLLRKAGVANYEAFGRGLLESVRDIPVSFEVIADEPREMERQARKIAGWGPNVYVKIPGTNTRGESTHELVRRLAGAGVQINVTALLTLAQIEKMAEAVDDGVAAIISLFAGRVADTGRDPVPVIRQAVSLLGAHPKAELLWASPRELLNVIQADEAGCHIITLTADLLAKLPLIGKDLAEYSRETVAMFRGDAQRAGYEL
ncbi:MAG TPA: transaldolase [Chloroflexota bacterium]|nr:transaldolase [Chloroflexota bacterium]